MPTLRQHRKAAEMVSERWTGYTLEYLVNGKAYNSYHHAMAAAINTLKRAAQLKKIRS